MLMQILFLSIYRDLYNNLYMYLYETPTLLPRLTYPKEPLFCNVLDLDPLRSEIIWILESGLIQNRYFYLWKLSRVPLKNLNSCLCFWSSGMDRETSLRQIKITVCWASKMLFESMPDPNPDLDPKSTTKVDLIYMKHFGFVLSTFAHFSICLPFKLQLSLYLSFSFIVFHFFSYHFPYSSSRWHRLISACPSEWGEEA